jgi:hypothetical protein
MANATPKNDWLREMREAKEAARKRKPAPAVKAVVAPALDSAPRVNKASADVNKNAAYQAKWRKANAAMNQLRAREGMRKRCAEGKS